MEPYASQEKAIASKALRQGIQSSTIQSFFHDSLAQLRRDFPSGRSSDWLLSRAEYLVWERFFPGDPFPGKIGLPVFPTPLPQSSPLIKTEPGIKTEPMSEITNSGSASVTLQGGDLTVRDWVHDRFDSDHVEKLQARGDDLYRPTYNENFGRLSRPVFETPKLPNFRSSARSGTVYVSQSHVIRGKAEAHGIDRHKLEKAFEEKTAFVETNHQNKSHDWQKWAIEAAVWARFFEKDKFPGIEPNSRNASAPSRGVSDKPVLRQAGEYHSKERIMEELAIKRGIRREFFQYLQRARDQARAEHRHCTSEIRHFVADRMTWDKFFSMLAFIGVEPKIGHFLCKDDRTGVSPPKGPASMVQYVHRPAPSQIGANVPASAVQSNCPAPSQTVQAVMNVPVTLAPPEVRHPSSQAPAEMLVALGNIRNAYIKTEGDKCGIVMMSPDPVFCEVAKVNEIFYYFSSDDSRSLAAIGEDLKCVLHYHRTSKSRHLLLWATSVVDGDNTALNRGQAFLQGWVKRILSFGMVTPSFYWNEMRTTMDSIADQSPGDCWKEYKEATGATSVDCLLVEEAAKREGKLRMVYDEVADEVVTLKELLKKDRYRSGAGSGARPRNAQMLGNKRKLDDGSSDADQTKRLCI
ncbi:hypothetical protein EG329_009370 [Mollisiaceae sp. DMI_Dod_QoI]|nr:hypothetical protein EG329_009370 [Helotiales sp. DMI_Dod_QoI]